MTPGSRPPEFRPAISSGTFYFGPDLPVRRLGFGTMRLTGSGVWGEPADRAEAIAVLRRAVEMGINLLDTADPYGPEVAETPRWAEALYPYPFRSGDRDQGRFQRPGSRQVAPEDGRPTHLREACEGSLRSAAWAGAHRSLPLYRIDPKAPSGDQIGALARSAASKARFATSASREVTGGPDRVRFS